MVMYLIPIKTRPLLPPQDDLFQALGESTLKLQEGDIVCITSKVVAIHEGRCVKITPKTNKEKLAIQEAEAYIPISTQTHGFLLTIKHNTLIASSGIDESNGNGYLILWPKDPKKSAKEIWQHLTKRFKIKNLGVILTDSHVTPLRRGVSGISIGFYGFNPVRSMMGKPDIFGRKLQHTAINVPDALAPNAVYLMGEANEQTPAVILRDVPNIEFTDKDLSKNFLFEIKEDIYKEVLGVFRKRKKG